MAHSRRGLWDLVIEQWRNEFNKRECPIPTTIVSEKAFRTGFQDLCRSQREYFYTTLLVKLHFATISAVARTMDATFDFVPPFSLAALVFGTCFVSVQYGSQSHLGMTGIIELLGRLNKAIPPLYTEIDRFLEDSDLQGILRETINIYMEYLFFIIDCVKPGSTSLSSDPKTDIEVKAEDAAAKIKTLETRFGQRLERRSSNSWSFGSNPPADAQNFPGSQPRFTYVKFLGRGSFGQVHEVRESSTGEVYAKKIIYLRNRGYDSEALECNVQAEFDTMKKLTHIHIVRVLLPQKESDSFTILMLPVADRDLRAYLENCIKDEYPSEALLSILHWFGCLLHALAFAHRCSIIHQDVKPSNILVKDEGGRLQIYLADFGMAKDFSDCNASATSNDNVRGTPVYRAPEVRPGQARGRAADIFSLGCVFSEMFTVCCGRSLEQYQEFRRARDKEENQLAFRENLSKVSSWLHGLAVTQDENEDSGGAVSLLIRRMMREDPDKRPTAREAIQTLKNTGKPDDLFCPNCI